VPTQSYMKMIN